MMKVRSVGVLLGSTSILALALVTPLAASAQEIPAQDPTEQPQTTAPPEEDTTEVSEVVVTGSRLGRTNLTATSPVAVLSGEDIALDRALNVEEVLNELPQFSNGIGAANTGSDARGATSLDLRGLGQNRTLVLINGTRAVPFSFRNSVDVNAIPGPLIERVEVLTGGASAVYGADAVAGVVNFILRDDFEGFEANATYNISDEGYVASRGVNLTVGANLDGGRGNVTAYLGVSEREGLLKGDRDFAAPERTDTGLITTRPRGGAFTRSDNAAVFNVPGTLPALSPRFAFNETGGLTSVAEVSGFSETEVLIAPLERITAATFFNYDLIGSVEAYGRATITRSELADQLGPPTAGVTFLVQRDNPFLTPQLDAVVAGAFNLNRAGTGPGTDAFRASASRAFVELGLNRYETQRTTFQTQFGLRGDFTENVGWDGYVQYGRTDDQVDILGEGIVSRVAQAANVTVNAAGQAVCVDPSGGCVPVNLFGPGSISPEAAAFIGQPLQQARERDQFVAAVAVTGDSADFLNLPAGPVGFAAGFEYREETGEVEFDSAIQTGQTFNQGRRPNFGGGFEVSELFGEISVPLLKDLPFFQELDFEAAYRRSDYSTAGEVDAYKLGGNWALNDSLRFRGAFQTVVRAPNIGELFGALGSVPLTAGLANDPCQNPATSGADPAVCRATGAPAAPYTQDLTGALFLFGGNPNLQPEEGETVTFGAVITPAALPGFSLTADYYDIQIDNAINAVLPNPALQTCYVIVRDANNPFCGRIIRGADGQIDAVDSTDVNVQSLKVEGVDVSARYAFDLPANLPGDRVALDYAADFLLNQSFKNGAAAAEVDCTGRFGAACALGGVQRVLPEYRHRANAAWISGPLTVRGTWRVIGEVEDSSATRFNVETIEAQHYFDVSAAYDINPSLRVIAGIENLLDEEPPILGGNQADANTIPASYDVIGRRLGVSLRFRR